MIDVSCINHAPIKDCLVLLNTRSRAVVQNTLHLAQTFSTEQQPMQSLHPDAEVYFQLDLGLPSLQAPCSGLLEVTFIGAGVGEGRLRQVSKPALWWHWFSGIITRGGGLP